MGALNFETGRKTYLVNGNQEISFNPTDTAFVDRLFALADKLEQMQAEKPDTEHHEDVFKIARQRDAEMREEIDKAFEAPVCEKIFGTTNVFSLADGLPICMNFLLAVIDEIDAAADEVKSGTNPRVDAYLRKYEKKYGKYMKK